MLKFKRKSHNLVFKCPIFQGIYLEKKTQQYQGKGYFLHLWRNVVEHFNEKGNELKKNENSGLTDFVGKKDRSSVTKIFLDAFRLAALLDMSLMSCTVCFLKMKSLPEGRTKRFPAQSKWQLP